jgi:hypothetical protein
MLSYPIPEAEELLTNKLSAAQQSLSNCEEDMDFLREQVTVRTCAPFYPTHTSMILSLSALYLSILSHIPSSPRIYFEKMPILTSLPSFQTMEVATARVYNWDIGQKRKEEAAAA